MCQLSEACSLPDKSALLPDNILTNVAKYASNADNENRDIDNSLVTEYKELRTVRIFLIYHVRVSIYMCFSLLTFMLSFINIASCLTNTHFVFSIIYMLLTPDTTGY